jgi:hypothetical protein
MKKNLSLYGLPEKVEFCSKCTISNQRPRSVIEFKNNDNQKKGIRLGKHKICEACYYNETKKKIDWEEREKKLIKLLDKYRKSSGYDCIIPGSGGKDSAFASHILKYKYKVICMSKNISVSASLSARLSISTHISIKYK